MDRTEMINKINLLTKEVESLTEIKAHRLEAEQAQKSEFFNWCRDQMISIHQMKYQFSQEVDQIHQEWVRANTDARNVIDRLRCVAFNPNPELTLS